VKYCMSQCILKNRGCGNNECRHWVNYEEDFNCTLVSVKENGDMTLSEISERTGSSVYEVRETLKKALRRIKFNFDKEFFG